MSRAPSAAVREAALGPVELGGAHAQVRQDSHHPFGLGSAREARPSRGPLGPQASDALPELGELASVDDGPVSEPLKACTSHVDGVGIPIEADESELRVRGQQRRGMAPGTDRQIHHHSGGPAREELHHLGHHHWLVSEHRVHP